MQIQLTDEITWDTELTLNEQTAEALDWFYENIAGRGEVISQEIQPESANAPRMWDGSLPRRTTVERWTTETHQITISWGYVHPITHRAFMARSPINVEITNV